MLRPFGGGEPTDEYVKVRTRRKEDFRLANIDLELECSKDLQPLLDEFGDKAMALYHQGFANNHDVASLEIMYYPSSGEDIFHSYNDEEDLVGGVDALISAFCDLIENLSSESRRIWNDCHRKEFDIGFESGNTAKTFHTQIRAETVKRCAELGASILITVYPYLNYELQPK